MTRLLDGSFSKGFETLRLLVQHRGFTEVLGDAIRAKGGVDRAINALRKEFFERWREIDGIVYFSVTSDGTTGEQWIERLGGMGFRVDEYAMEQVLRSFTFKSASGITTYVAVLKGVLFSENNRFTHKIRAKADKLLLQKPTPEVACLIREKFTDNEMEAMGLSWIITMHEPMVELGGTVLLTSRRDNGGSSFCLQTGNLGRRWERDNGFAFVVAST